MDRICPQTKEEVLASLFERYPALATCEVDIRAASDALVACYRSRGKLLVCGNGGSAADAEHIVGELMKSFRFKRAVDPAFTRRYRDTIGEEVPTWLEGALPAISLVSQTSFATAFCNDENHVGVFAQQVYGYGCPGDILVAISTSGNSANVVEGAKIARVKEMLVIALTGARESRLTDLSDICIRVPETEVFKIQELHLPVYHALCAVVEAELFGGIHGCL